MKVLAIGGTGFIGSRVVRFLAEQGHEVAVLRRGNAQIEDAENVLYLCGNRDASGELRRALVHFRPEIVLDVIPYTESQAQELVEVLRGIARRLVALSSADVYRNYDGFRRRSTVAPDAVPLSEDAPLRETRYPYRGYGLPFDWADDYDKILVEQVVLGGPGLSGTVLRLPAVYGPGDKQHRLRPYCTRMSADRPVVLLGKEQSTWRWTRGYVEDVSAAIALAVSDDRAAEHVYNVGEERALTERQWVEQIGIASDWQGEIIEVPNEQLPEQLRQPFDFRYELATDTSRIREELSFDEPVARHEALQQTVQWERTLPSERDQPDYATEDEVIAVQRDAV